METSSRLIQSILGSKAEVNGAALTKEAFETAGMSQLDEALSSEPDWVVLHIGGTSHRAAKGHGVSDAPSTRLPSALRRHKRNVPFALVIYGSPYLLNRLPAAIALSDAVIVAYQDDSRTVGAVANALTGAGPAGGHLPVATNISIGPWNALDGTNAVGFSATPIATAATIDSIVIDAIDGGAMPGCRVVVAHEGSIVHDGIYGHWTGNSRCRQARLRSREHHQNCRLHPVPDAP